MIPKRPIAPSLTTEQIAKLTAIVFGPVEPMEPCDLVFVFGSRHPRLCETAFKLYRTGVCGRFLVAGGSPANARLPDTWLHGDVPEAVGIRAQLVDLGVPADAITIEDRSTNSSENVVFAKKVFDFGTIKSLVFVAKAHAAGRQYLTLRKHLPRNIKICSHTYNTTGADGIETGRHTWQRSEEGRSIVWGEYLRIVHYGSAGDIDGIESPLPIAAEASTVSGMGTDGQV